MSRGSLFPDGACIAVVSSWDGGSAQDVRMAQVLEQYGWKGTFFLPIGPIGGEGYLSEDEVRAISRMGHEIGILCPGDLAATALAEELREARRYWAAIADQPILSLAYADGSGLPSPALVEAARAAGFVSARTTQEADLFATQLSDLLRLPVTAHALSDHMGLRAKWDAIEAGGEGIFYLRGRSDECGEDNDQWAQLECNLAWFCGHTHAWYCTQGELVTHLLSRK